jgi:hypothetical protein
MPGRTTASDVFDITSSDGSKRVFVDKSFNFQVRNTSANASGHLHIGGGNITVFVPSEEIRT